MTKTKKQPMEFSKKIIIVTALVNLIVIFCAIAMSYVTQSTDVYAYLIPSVGGATGIGLGFYYKKAERENLLKIEKEYGSEIAQKAKQLEDEFNEFNN